MRIVVVYIWLMLYPEIYKKVQICQEYYACFVFQFYFLKRKISPKSLLYFLIFFFPLSDVEFNVSDMFAMPTHPATPDPESGPDRKRPISQVGQEGDGSTPRKDRYLSRPNLSLSLPLTLPSRPKTLVRQESRGPVVSALYVVADESITVTETPTEDLPSPDFKAVP